MSTATHDSRTTGPATGPLPVQRRRPDVVAPPRATARQWLALVVLVLPTLLTSMNGTILSFALPTISTSLRPTATQLLWVVDVYPLVLAGLLVAMGSFGDRIGRRRLLLVGSAGFGLVSLLAAFAPTAGALVGARALLGVFGAMLMPPTLALLRSVFPDGGQRRLAVAIWATGFSAGAAVGPVVGGVLLEHFWWGAAFLVAVPVSALIVVAGPRLLPESRESAPGPVDLLSVVLSLTTMLPLVYAVKGAAEHGLTDVVVASALLGAASGVLFVRRQLRRARPLLDLSLFRVPVFSASVAANLMGIFAFVGLLFFTSQYLQLVVGLSPLAAALHLLPSMAATIATGLLAVRLARRWALHVLVPAGLATSALGYALATQLSGAPEAGLLVAASVLVGAGVGLAETLTNDAILTSAPADRAGAASAVSETAYEVGAVLGTAVLGSVLGAVYRSHLAVPAGVDHATADAATQTLGGAVEAAGLLGGADGAALLASAQGSFAAGVDVTAAIGGGVVLLAAVVVALALRPRAGR
ncbi:MFS transporter [Pseudokineococcus marinus]|uniref:MFS transporter n=1 Tax=Pseudokineococcus marinus TaxID=351215 RepID=A0A849BLQ6_9ACTN|nr:MFS transporter [Pseudokineococcus marinus]NNH22275.1 MFS transporter [Pseudokineococcus marinus]